MNALRWDLSRRAGQAVMYSSPRWHLIAHDVRFLNARLRGKALRATAVNRTGARLMGISSHTSGQLTFLMAALIWCIVWIVDRPHHHRVLRLWIF